MRKEYFGFGKLEGYEVGDLLELETKYLAWFLLVKRGETFSGIGCYLNAGNRIGLVIDSFLMGYEVELIPNRWEYGWVVHLLVEDQIICLEERLWQRGTSLTIIQKAGYEKTT